MNEEQLKAMFAELLKPLQTEIAALKAAAPTPVKAPDPVKPPDPAPDPAANSALVEMRRTMEEQKKQIEALNKVNEEAAKRADTAERKSAIDAALSGFEFARPTARNTAVDLISSHVNRLEDGTLVAGNNLTVDTFVKEFITGEHAYLLAPVGGGGSGVTPNRPNVMGQKPVDLNDIKPGMSQETREGVLAAIRNAAGQLGR